MLAGSFAVVAAGLSRSQVGFFRGATTARALLVFTSALGARLCLSYPQVLRPAGANNLIASLRAERRDDAFWLGLIWTVTGFLCSFGMSFFFYRVLYDLALPLATSLAGMGTGQALRRRIPAETFRRYFLAALVLTGLYLAVHAA